MRGLVVSTKYKGNIEVTFPIMCSTGIVLIESSDSSVVVKEKETGSAGQELGILCGSNLPRCKLWLGGIGLSHEVLH